MTDTHLTRLGIVSGRYEAIIRAAQAPELTVATETVTVDPMDLDLQAVTDGEWRLCFSLPDAMLNEGVQTLLICDQRTGTRLDSVTCTMGTPSDLDLVSELNLLRSELDTLKRAFQRHCTETS